MTGYLDDAAGGGARVPNVVRHLVAKEPLDVLRLDPVRVLAVYRLPGLQGDSAVHYSAVQCSADIVETADNLFQ